VLVNVLIGTEPIVMDDCYIESGSIIAAGAVLLEGEGVQRLKNKR
jgi:carbonic anhydrase/acetyltransferase-like protein (isoleucine patch superfamily)